MKKKKEALKAMNAFSVKNFYYKCFHFFILCILEVMYISSKIQKIFGKKLRLLAYYYFTVTTY